MSNIYESTIKTRKAINNRYLYKQYKRD